jgi:Tol biopolymer transport system component
VKPELGSVNPLGITRNGSLLYSRYVTEGSVHTASVNLETGETSDSKPLQQRAVLDFGLDVSPDGRSLAYVAHNGSELSSRFIVVHDLGTGEDREIRPRNGLAIHVTGGNKWSPDGKSYMVTGETAKSGQGIYAIDLRTGDVRLLVSRPGLQAVTPDWLDGGRSVIYCARDAGRSERIFIRNLETGADREILTGFEGARHINFVIHPDGDQLAFAPQEDGRYRTVYVMTMGGAPRKRYELSQSETLFLSSWTKEGRLLFAKSAASVSPPSWTLWSLPVESGEPRVISVPANQRFTFSLDQSGKRIAYGVTKTDTEVWSLENIGAVLSTSR